MPITPSKIQYDTRSVDNFGALEQTLRLRLVSGLINIYFLIIGSLLTHTVS
jgi:hypothetical protein